jgi:hypothetical protein
MSAAEVAGDFLLCVLAFTLSDNQDSFSCDLAESCDYGPVVTEASVTVKLSEVFYHEVQIVGEKGSVGVASDLNGLPGGKVGIYAFELGDLLSLKPSNLFGIVDSLDGAEPSQLIHLSVEIGYSIFKLEIVSVCRFVTDIRHNRRFMLILLVYHGQLSS